MSSIKIRPSGVLLFLLILLPIYQDSPLSKYIGAAGYSLLMPVSFILFFYYLIVRKRIIVPNELQTLFILGIMLCLVSFFSCIGWLITGHGFTLLGETLFIKDLKVILQYISYPLYALLLFNVAKKNSISFFCKSCVVVLSILVIISLIEKSQLPYSLQSLHYAAAFPYYRIRLLTLESSWTTMLVYVYSAISLYYCYFSGRVFLMTYTLMCSAFLILISGSKTLILSLAISVLIYVFFAFKKLSKKTVIIFILLGIGGVGFALYFLPQLVSAFKSDISEFTSVATRSYTIIIGFMIGIISPVGFGGLVSLGVFQEVMKKYLWIFDVLPIRLNTREILDMISSTTDQAVTAKSGLMQYNMYWGIIGTVILVKNFSHLTKQIKKNKVKGYIYLNTVFWSAVLLIAFSLNFSFEFWLLYAFLMILSRKDEVRKHLK